MHHFTVQSISAAVTLMHWISLVIRKQTTPTMEDWPMNWITAVLHAFP